MRQDQQLYSRFSCNATAQQRSLRRQIVPCESKQASLVARSTVLTRCNKMNATQTLSQARDVLADELAEALVQLKDKAEARALLSDLCTPAEVHTLAERWHVAKLLDADQMTYREIHDATGVSTTTIVRVARFLRQENNGGYRLVLDRMEAKE